MTNSIKLSKCCRAQPEMGTNGARCSKCHKTDAIFITIDDDHPDYEESYWGGEIKKEGR